MKKIKQSDFILFIALLGLLVTFTACESSKEKDNTALSVVNISSPDVGFIYLNGQYTGHKTPHSLMVTKGTHVLGVGMEKTSTYLRREVEVKEDIDVALTASDQPEPKVWKALWVGVHEVTGNSSTGRCSSRFSKQELDAGFDYFQWSIENHFEKMSFNTMKWDVERKDLETPIELHKASNTWFTLEPYSITELIPEVQPGEYDAVFVFWREKDGACSFQSSYFGLGWTDPMNEAIKTGYITIKFDAGNDINEKIDWYKNNDPGVWVHEWLHTVGENYFQDMGERLPEKGDDGLVIHAAEKYNYTYPWLDWYSDFIGGRVKAGNGSSIFYGIGPEAMLKCALRETAVSNCGNE